MLKNILFDLDGTLVNSGEGIMNALRYAYNKENVAIPLDEILRKFIGPPLMVSFQKYSNIDPQSQLAQSLLSDFQDFYDTTGWQQLQLYPQIFTLLQQLQQEDYSCYVTTAKPEPFAQKIIQYFQLSKYFQGIYGADLSEKMQKKDVIAQALKHEHIIDSQTCVMVGDRDTDVIGAKANDVVTIGVLYGFGNLQELQTAGAIATIKQPLELLTRIGSKHEKVL